MALFGWKFEELEKGKKFAFINASPLRHMPGEVKIGRQSIGRKDFSILSLIEGIKTHTELINAKRVVVDPVTSLIFQYPEMVERRTAILDLVDALVKTGATCLMTTELRAMGPTVERAIQLEEYLAHGVVIMSNAKVGKTYIRVLQVEKMRQTPIDMQPRPYKISGNGIEVFPKETIFVDYNEKTSPTTGDALRFSFRNYAFVTWLEFRHVSHAFVYCESDLGQFSFTRPVLIFDRSPR